MQGQWQRWLSGLQHLPAEERLVISLFVLACMVVIAVYFVQKVRGQIRRAPDPITDYLGDFRKMRDDGQIDEVEYRQVAQTISQTQQRLEQEQQEQQEKQQKLHQLHGLQPQVQNAPTTDESSANSQ